jgi:GAF domain-containing protein
MRPTRNRTPADPQQLVADLQRKLAQAHRELDERTAERNEGLAREAATAEVLGVINSSPGDLAPVFEAMLEKATSLCDAAHGALFIKDGECFRAIASGSTPYPFAEFLTREPVYFDLDPDRSIMGRTLQRRSAVQVADLRETEPYRNGLPIALAAVETGGSRTLLSVPMFREDSLIGIFQLARQEVRPFTDKQIALLQNFRSAGGDRDGERAADHRDARGPGAADCDRRSARRYQLLARRSCAGVRRDA